MSTQPTEKICSKCLLNKNIKRDYYLAANDMISVDNRLAICKDCISSLVDMDDANSLINVLRAVDRPFIKKTYEDSLTSGRAPFGEYMRMLATKQNRDKTYLDSEFTKEFANYSNKKELQDFQDGVELSEEGFTEESLSSLRKKWGKFEVEDYEFLEEFYREYSHSYATDTPVQVMLYKNIAKVHLQAEKALSSGDIKGYKDLMDLSSKLHNDGNIKPIQSSGANDDRGLSAYGLWIKEIEKEEPCEFFEEKPAYEDYDSFNKYWEKWFVRPLKNIFNISNDFDIKDKK